MNIRGEVIGINTMIATSSGGYQGIGFALPMNMAVNVYNQIIAHGRVVRGSIGISFNQELAPEVMKALGIKGGVIVESVTPGGPAERAGLKPEDFLIALNGSQIHDGDDFVDRIANMPIGSEASIAARSRRPAHGKDRHHRRPREGIQGRSAFRPVPSEDGVRRGSGGSTTVRHLHPRIGRYRAQTDELRPIRAAYWLPYVEEDSFAEDIGIREQRHYRLHQPPAGSSFDDVKAIQCKLKPGDAVAFRVMRASPIAHATAAATDWVGIWLGGTIPATK